MLISFGWAQMSVCLFVLMVTLCLVWIKRRNFFHLLFCAVFGVYLIGASSVAVFPFFIPIDGSRMDMLRSVNLIPFNFGNCFDYLPQNCVKGIFNNILLTVPFGFLAHFIGHIQLKHTPWLTLAIGCSFEFVQLTMALIFHISFRAIDINDVILNTTGAFIGYLFFKRFGSAYWLVIQKFKLQPKHIFAYIQEVVTTSTQ